jgi:hypothetical protein
MNPESKERGPEVVRAGMLTLWKPVRFYYYSNPLFNRPVSAVSASHISIHGVNISIPKSDTALPYPIGPNGCHRTVL